MLEALREEVLKANLDLVRHGLVKFTWGNVSGWDRSNQLLVIKPSGVPYEGMKAADLVVVNAEGKVVEGEYRPSSDTPTHLALYRAFPQLGGITHTHSCFASAFAQAGRGIPCYGTTHADTFYGEIPVTRPLTREEVECDYEWNTGLVIAERFRGEDILARPGVLVCSHGVFGFGKTAGESVFSAAVMEEVAKMALISEQLREGMEPAPDYLLQKHYKRKHGEHAYYGQKK